MFTKIDFDQWERKDHYEYYTKLLPCSYSLTAKLDVTTLYKTVKEKGYRFYPAVVYCVTKALNMRKEFRMAVNAEGEVGYWDQVHPNFTIFHEDDHTFSDVWTNYHEEFESFYGEMVEVMETYKDKKGVKVREGQPPNFYCISCVPWISFTGYESHVAGRPAALFPIITFGKYEMNGERMEMPMTLSISHAAADGYHTSQLFLLIQEIMDQFR